MERKDVVQPVCIHCMHVRCPPSSIPRTAVDTQENTDSHGNTCLQNDIIFFSIALLQRMHRKQRHEHQPWMTLLFQCQSPRKTGCTHTHTHIAHRLEQQASKQTKPHDRRSGFPEPPHFEPLQREAAAAATYYANLEKSAKNENKQNKMTKNYRDSILPACAGRRAHISRRFV